MEKLDRLGWTAGLSFSAFGVKAGIRATKTDALELIREYLPPQWKPSKSPIVSRLYSLKVGGQPSRPGLKQFHLLYGNVVRIGRSLELQDVLRLFESDLQLYVAENAPRRVFIHAGVVGWKGRAILIPGRSMSGKTTLVAELFNAGATYYSDEYAVFDSDGRIYPYPRHLGVRENGSLTPRKRPVESFGGSIGAGPIRVGLVLVTRYEKDAIWRPRHLTAGQGALELLNNTVSIQRKPEVVFPLLKRVAEEAVFAKSARGEAKVIADTILNQACLI